jgi:hypothetical protein
LEILPISGFAVFEEQVSDALHYLCTKRLPFKIEVFRSCAITIYHSDLFAKIDAGWLPVTQMKVEKHI